MNDSVLSAVLYADFSDHRPGEVVDQPLAYMERHEFGGIVLRHHGVVLETVSRKLMAAFPRPQDAMACAYELRAAIGRIRSLDNARRFLSCRMLLAYGRVLPGDKAAAEKLAYDLSWHIANTPQDTIVGLKDFVDQLPKLPFPPPRMLGKPQKGHAPLMLIAAPEGQMQEPEEQTRTGSMLAAATIGQFTELTLRVGKTVRVIHPTDCPVSVGRSKTSGLMVKGDSVSRVHGHIEFNNDKFYYSDDSRNGSFVLLQDGREIRLLKEPVVLAGDGVISLGLPVKDQTGEVIRYSCIPVKLRIEKETLPRGASDDDKTRKL